MLVCCLDSTLIGFGHHRISRAQFSQLRVGTPMRLCLARLYFNSLTFESFCVDQRLRQTFSMALTKQTQFVLSLASQCLCSLNKIFVVSNFRRNKPIKDIGRELESVKQFRMLFCHVVAIEAVGVAMYIARSYQQ